MASRVYRQRYLYGRYLIVWGSTYRYLQVHAIYIMRPYICLPCHTHRGFSVCCCLHIQQRRERERERESTRVLQSSIIGYIEQYGECTLYTRTNSCLLLVKYLENHHPTPSPPLPPRLPPAPCPPEDQRHSHTAAHPTVIGSQTHSSISIRCSCFSCRYRYRSFYFVFIQRLSHSLPLSLSPHTLFQPPPPPPPPHLTHPFPLLFLSLFSTY